MAPWWGMRRAGRAWVGAKKPLVAGFAVDGRYWTVDSGDGMAGSGSHPPPGEPEEVPSSVQVQDSNASGRGETGWSIRQRPARSITRDREDWVRLEIAARGIRLRWGANRLIESLRSLSPSCPSFEQDKVTRKAA
ncbi:MAG: hypothetical protein JSV91_00660 [Phycisphaerales bacterium]|nr:MAG: hypothetical protein JSV91_00660 [Phycisphaerales bacterium]